MKRILITGSSGYIGRHIAKTLFKKDFYIRLVDIKSLNRL